MSTRRRSTRLNCNSPKQNGGGDGRIKQRKSSSPGKPRLLMLTNTCLVRRSPRFTPVDGKIDNVCSVPVTGKFGLRKRKISSAPVEKESLESEGLTFKDIATIAKSLEMEIVSECQDKNNNAEGRSQVSAKRKVDSDALSSSIKSSSQSRSSNKRMRKSPRFTKGMENGGEDNIGKSEEQEKSVQSRNPSSRSLRLSGIVENGQGETLNTIKNCGPALYNTKQVRGTEELVQICENGNYCEATKKCEGDGLVSSKQELLDFPSSCIKTAVNGSRDKALGKRRSSDLHENGTSNGQPMTTALEEQESSLQGDCGAADNGVTEEMHANSTVIYISDKDKELPAKNERNSVEYKYTKTSNGDKEDASGSTLSSGGNRRQAPLDLNSPTNSTKGKGARVTRTAVREKHEHGIFFFIGEPIPCEEAQERWRWRYDLKERKSKRKGQESEDDEDKIVANVECHYSQAKVDKQTFSLGDFANIKGEGEETHIGKIVELFKTTDGESYFRVQWFYRATDTVMKQQAIYHDKRRLFYSTAGLKPNTIKSDFYFDMEYCLEYSTFRTLRNLKSSENKLEYCTNVWLWWNVDWVESWSQHFWS